MANASELLVVFADGLKPTQSYTAKGTDMVQKVFEFLKKQKAFSVAKDYISGSVGKSTSVVYPDFDCVVFLNRKSPPFEETVKEFAGKLRENATNLGIVASSLKTTRITVCLKFKNGVELDLLPAACFSQHSKEAQYQAVLEKLRTSSDPSLYSSSLAEIQIDFMRTQFGPTKQLARIAKYWFKLCTLDKTIYGGSSIMEILSVVVALDLNPSGRGNSFDMLCGFRAFLEKIAKIDTLKIAFFREGAEWKLVTGNEFNLAKYKNFYDEEILRRRNFIIEPANPFNDLAANISPDDSDNAARLKDFAKKMLVRLDQLVAPGNNEMKTVSPDGSRIEKVHYEKLFEPFIMRLRDAYSNSAIPTHVFIDYHYQNYTTTANVNAEVRKCAGNFFEENKEAKSVYKTVMNNLLFLIRGKAVRSERNALTFNEGLPNIEKYEDVKTAVSTLIDANFGVKQLIVESCTNVDHESAYVTLTIPYRFVRKERIVAVRFSMKWSSAPTGCILI